MSGRPRSTKMKKEAGSCLFCSAEAIKWKNLKDIELKTEEYWPYLRQTEWSQPYHSYFEDEANIQTTPSMCPVCFRRVKDITKCHRKIFDLQIKLNRLRKQLENAVKGVYKSINRSKNKTTDVPAAIKAEPSKVSNVPSLQEISTVTATATTDSIMDLLVQIKSEVTDNVNLTEPAVSSQPVMSASSSKSIRPSASDLPEHIDWNENDMEYFSSLEEGEAMSDPDPIPEESSNSDDDSESGSESSPPPPPSNRKRAVRPKDPEWEPKTKYQKRIVDRGSKKFKYNPRPCVLCRVKLPPADLYQHMKGHVGDYAFQCETCPVTFPSRLSAAYFDKNHRGSEGTCKDIANNVQCELCLEEVTFHRAFVHFERHETQEKNYACPLSSCEKVFTLRQSLELHLGGHELKRGKTSKEGGKEKAPKGRPKLAFRECELCGDILPIPTTAINKHVVAHVGEFAYQCPAEKCRLTFLSRYSRRCIAHQSSTRAHKPCSGTLKPICDECNAEFVDFNRLRPHLRRHETLEKNFTCPIENCGKQFTIRQSMEFHLNLHSFVDTLQSCGVCKGVSKLTPNQMEEHLRGAHGVEDVVQCRYCPFVFSNVEEYIEHLSCHVRSGVTCHLCDWQEIFRHGGLLRKHYFTEHQIGREYLCEHCVFSTFWLTSLNEHVEEVHKGNKKSKFFCEVCEHKPVFSCAISLRSHNTTTHGGETYSCKFCSKSFTNIYYRDGHEKHVHLGVERREFPCPQCEMVFTRKTRLNNHLDSVHSTEKKYQCSAEGCKERFKTKPTLRLHVKACHEGTSYVCDTCGRGFKHKGVLETHMRIHTGERPYVCNLCGMRFRQSASLYTHCKAHERHGESFVPKKTFDRTPRGVDLKLPVYE